MKRNWFGKQAPVSPRAPEVQLRSGVRHPFGMLGDYVPLRRGEMQLYRAVREAVPVVDAAIYKLIRMTGGVSVQCSSQTAEEQLNEFLRTVPIGRGQIGLNAFLECYLDSLLTSGQAVGEIVPAVGNREIAALLCARVEDIEIKEGDNPLEFKICGTNQDGKMEELPYQNLILFTPLNPETENPYGVSLLRSLPFLTDILMKIYAAIGANWERAGNVRYSVICKGGEELDPATAQERGRSVAAEWARAMEDSKNGTVRDFVAVGDVEIKVIGADGPVLDSQIPVRQILEQLVARTGIPPFMLGLSWSSTERMSAQQADLLTSEITAIRRSLEPMLSRIAELWLRMHGYDDGVEILWEDINLQDLVEEARAELYRAQAEALRKENGA